MRSSSVIEAIKEDFGYLENWEDRYNYIIEFGKKLQPYPEAFKTDEWRVHGCVSRVWLKPADDSSLNNLHFLADSDALITKGLVALLLSVVNHQPAEVVLKEDFSFLNEIGLGQHLTPTRVNGLWAMVKRIKELAGQTI
jgi:cysteine desulfuration protein SufE